MASGNVHCLRCDSVLVYHHGQNQKGHSSCSPSASQSTYPYQAGKPGFKGSIVDMAFNGAGVRDTARTLKVGIKTAIRTLKNSRRSE